MTNNTGKSLNWSIILNIILIIAVAVIYFLHFTGKHPPAQDAGITASYPPGEGLRIAYVDSDSILANYTLAIKKGQELEEKSRRMDSDFKKRQDQYEKDAAYFQEQVASNQLSEKSAQFIYNQLMEEQQKLYELQNQYTSELAESEMLVNMMLLDSVTNFLERFNQKYRFDFILGHNPGSNILLKNPQFNITDQVIRGLNDEYKEESSD